MTYFPGIIPVGTDKRKTKKGSKGVEKGTYPKMIRHFQWGICNDLLLVKCYARLFLKFEKVENWQFNGHSPPQDEL